MIRTFLMSDPVVQRLGWVLVHSLWEGALVALLLAWALHRLRRRLPDARYVISCAALALLAALPVVNFVLVPRFHPPTTAMATLSNAGALALEPITAAPLPEAAAIGLPFATELALPALPEAPGTAPPPGVTWDTVRASVERLFPWLVGAWALGVTVLSVLHLGGWVRVRRIRRSHTRSLGPRWEKTLARLARRLGMTRPVLLLESALVQVPAVVGWLRPVILVPATAVSGLSPREMVAILAHELAHVRRHDYLINVLQAVVETVLFYHPAVWWVSERVRVEREDCCDDLAARTCGSKVRYARALTAMEELRGGDRSLPRPALAAVGRGGPLLRRIRRLLGRETPPPPRPRRRHAVAAAAVVVVVAVASVVAQSRLAQEEAPPPAAPTPEANDAAAAVPAAAEEPDPVPAAPRGELSADDIARIDSVMLGKLQARDRIKADLARTRFTMLANHPTVVTRLKSLRAVEEEIEQHAEEFRRKWTVNGTAAVPEPTLTDLAQREPRLQRLLESRDAAKVELMRARRQSGDSHPKVAAIRDEVDALTQQIQSVAAEVTAARAPAPAPAAPAAEAAGQNPAAPADGGNYFISGVPRAGAYSLGARPLNLLQALISGGLDVDQSRSRQVVLFRRAPGDDRETVTTVTVGDLIEDRDKDVVLKPDDMIMVKAAPALADPVVPAAPAVPAARAPPPGGAPPVPPLVGAPEGLWKMLEGKLEGMLDRRLSVVSAYVSEDGKAAFVAIRDGAAPRGGDSEAVWYRLKVVGDLWTVDTNDGSGRSGHLTTAGRALEAFLREHPSARRFAKPFTTPPVGKQQRPGAGADADAGGGAVAAPPQNKPQADDVAAEMRLRDLMTQVVKAMQASDKDAALPLARQVVQELQTRLATAADDAERQQLANAAGRFGKAVQSLEAGDLYGAGLVISYGQPLWDRLPSPDLARVKALREEVVQRSDKERRQKALDELARMLSSGAAADKQAALTALQWSAEVPFDRGRFLPAVTHLLSDGDAAVRYAALGAVAALAAPVEQGGAPAPPVDTLAIAKLADDPDSHVRSKVAQALAAVSRGRPQPPAELMATVETLLNDPSPAVQVGTIHALWGWPLSEKGERRLIELSRDPVVGYPAIYYALSTLPTKSRPVAERLIEVMQAKGAAADRNSTGRAAWGLSHFPIADDAKELVIDAFIKELDESTDGSVRREAVYGLSRLGGDKAVAKLKALAREEEAQQLRREAADAVRRLKG